MRDSAPIFSRAEAAVSSETAAAAMILLVLSRASVCSRTLPWRHIAADTAKLCPSNRAAIKRQVSKRRIATMYHCDDNLTRWMATDIAKVLSV